MQKNELITQNAILHSKDKQTLKCFSNKFPARMSTDVAIFPGPWGDFFYYSKPEFN